MSDLDYKPVNPFVKKSLRQPERPPGKPRQVHTFKAPFAPPAETAPHPHPECSNTPAATLMLC